jgi:hypothetical protein
MPRSVTRLKLLVSCTSELQAERRLLDSIVADANRVLEDSDGVTLRTIDWRRDVVPGVGTDPQQVINAQTQDYEIYLGMLGSRFGTPTPRAGSGTEEEFEAAYRRFRADPTSVRLLFYFRTGVSGGVMELDPDQLRRVQEFRDRLGTEAGVLFGEFAASEEFIQLSRDHLIQLVRSQWGGTGWKPIPGLEPAVMDSGSRLVDPARAAAALEEEEPGILDLRVGFDQAFDTATAAVRQIADLMGKGAEADRQWTARIQAATAARINPREAQALINSKAADFGRRARELRTLRTTFRGSSEEAFDLLIELVEMQLVDNASTADEVRAGLEKLLAADSLVRTARDTYLRVGATVARLPEPTREFRIQKRNLMQQVDQLSADIGYWLDRTAELRTRFELQDGEGAPGMLR